MDVWQKVGWKSTCGLPRGQAFVCPRLALFWGLEWTDGSGRGVELSLERGMSLKLKQEERDSTLHGMDMHPHGQYMRNLRKVADVHGSAVGKDLPNEASYSYVSARHEMQKEIGNLDGSDSPTTSIYLASKEDVEVNPERRRPACNLDGRG